MIDLIQFNLIDKNNTCIQAVAFDSNAIRLNQLLEDGKIYKISSGSIQISNKTYTKIPHDFLIHFNRFTQIE